MPSRSCAAVLVAVALTTGGLAGCGGSSGSSGLPPVVSAESPDGSYPGQSAEEVLAAARVAAAAARSVRITGSLTEAGRTVSYSVTEVPGKGSAGTVTIDGETAQVRRIGSAVYARPTKKFMVSQAGAAGARLYTTLRGRWLKADEQIAAAAGLGSVSDLGTLDSAFVKAVPTDGTLSRVPGALVGGVKTTGVTFDADGRQGTVYVAATAPGRPVRVEIVNGSTVTFSRWDEKATVTAPPGAFDIADLDLGSLGLGSTG